MKKFSFENEKNGLQNRVKSEIKQIYFNEILCLILKKQNYLHLKVAVNGTRPDERDLKTTKKICNFKYFSILNFLNEKFQFNFNSQNGNVIL